MIYLNDNEPYVAKWLAALYPYATVDSRSICDVRAGDLAWYRRVHMFAGIGGWEYALSLASWPDDREVWTGSCPCQPFSNSGKRRGTDDERHLWPEFLRLISERRPATIFGEQVASPLGRRWLSGVRADLEDLGYAVGAADLCAASVGAPHIRQRLYWVANSKCRAAKRHRFEMDGAQGGVQSKTGQRERLWNYARDGSNSGGMSDSDGRVKRGEHGQQQEDSSYSWMGNANLSGSQGRSERRDGAGEWIARSSSLVCLDGKVRRIPTEPEFFPLAHGVPGRMGRIRAYGNAIVPQLAAKFIRAFLETGP